MSTHIERYGISFVKGDKEKKFERVILDEMVDGKIETTEINMEYGKYRIACSLFQNILKDFDKLVKYTSEKKDLGIVESGEIGIEV
jgi:hypothetical protein